MSQKKSPLVINLRKLSKQAPKRQEFREIWILGFGSRQGFQAFCFSTHPTHTRTAWHRTFHMHPEKFNPPPPPPQASFRPGTIARVQKVLHLVLITCFGFLVSFCGLGMLCFLFRLRQLLLKLFPILYIHIHTLFDVLYIVHQQSFK